jgi:hypothetical protein
MILHNKKVIPSLDGPVPIVFGEGTEGRVHY